MKTFKQSTTTGLPAMLDLWTAPAVLTLMALLTPSAAVQAAEASARSMSGLITASTPGFATAESGGQVYWAVSDAEGNGYEFLGGVGASAFASVKGGSTASSRGQGLFVDSFRVSLGQVADVGNATSFLLTVPIVANGTADVDWTEFPNTPNFTGHGSAQYTYSWSVAGQSGSGFYNKAKHPSKTEVTITETSVGGLNPSFMVSLGQTVDLRLSAEAFAIASGAGNMSAGTFNSFSGAADFGHTLRWGGVSSITGFDSAGQEVALPTGFKLALVSEQTGFDYTDAAGPNPYTTSPVPEPSGWVLMVAGFAVIGSVVRRRGLARV